MKCVYVHVNAGAIGLQWIYLFHHPFYYGSKIHLNTKDDLIFCFFLLVNRNEKKARKNKTEPNRYFIRL